MLLASFAVMPSMAMAQYEEDTENSMVSLAGRKGFTISSKKGDFVFKPYLLTQIGADLNRYNGESLDRAYNQDNFTNSGFSVPYMVLDFTDKVLGEVSFNLSISAATSGGVLSQQAWLDVQFKKQLALRIGKFKTFFSHAYLTTLGKTPLSQLPISLTSPVIMPYSLSTVTPNVAISSDPGVELHGLIGERFGYEVGLFNGTGISVSTALKAISDDWCIPSLPYTGRLAYMPKGVMPSTQDNPNYLREDKMPFGLSGSVNVESKNESINDIRVGLEFAMLKNKLYLAAKAYYMSIGFTKRQKADETYHYLGGYVQDGYFVAPRVRVTARYNFFDRNDTGDGGSLSMPVVGMNYLFKGYNLELQAIYQCTARWGYDTQLDRGNDNLGLATHSAIVLLQCTF